MILMSIWRREVKAFCEWGVPLAIFGAFFAALACSSPAAAAVPKRLKDGLSSSSVKVRVIAVAAVARTKDPTAATLLRPMLADPEPAVRAAAVDGLTLLQDLASAGAIEQLKDDPDSAVRAVVGRAIQKFADAFLQVDTGDLSGKASPELLERLQSTFETELKRLAQGVVTKRGGVKKGLGAMLKIRSITKGSDGGNEFLEVKCDLTLVELPGKILRVSSTATAAAGVEGKIPAKMEPELARDGIDACAPSLAKDFADYVKSRPRQ